MISRSLSLSWGARNTPSSFSLSLLRASVSQPLLTPMFPIQALDSVSYTSLPGELENAEDSPKIPGSLRGQVKLREIAETLLKLKEQGNSAGRALASDNSDNSPSYVSAFPNPKDREKVDFAALDVDGFLGTTRISADSLAFTPMEGVASQPSVAQAPRTGMVTTPGASAVLQTLLRAL